MIHIAVIENKKCELKRIDKCLKKYFKDINKQYTINKYSTPDEIEEYIKYENRPFDIIFFNILLYKKNEISMLNKIKSQNSNSALVLMTRKTSFKYRGCVVKPEAFLLKPIIKERIDKILDRIIDILNSTNKDNKKYSVRYREEKFVFRYCDIKYITSVGHYIYIHTNGHKIVKRFGKIDDEEAKLNDKRFLRTHKSYLINIDQIKYRDSFSFTLKDGTILPITVNKTKYVKKVYYEYLVGNLGKDM